MIDFIQNRGLPMSSLILIILSEESTTKDAVRHESSEDLAAESAAREVPTQHTRNLVLGYVR